jgi:hypothetical protein
MASPKTQRSARSFTALLNIEMLGLLQVEKRLPNVYARLDGPKTTKIYHKLLLQILLSSSHMNKARFGRNVKRKAGGLRTIPE